MAGICTLFSGSAGNCTYIGAEGDGLLIDAGVSARRIERALTEREIDPRSVRAIAVTHEHSDHTAGIRVLCKKYGWKLLASRGTLGALYRAGIFEDPAQAEVLSEKGAAVGCLQLTPFATPHDAAESCGYVVTLPDGRKVAVATDMGYVTDTVAAALRGCTAVVIESNHDVQMLQNGPYPYPLKQRILSDRGHLSNAACDALLPKLVDSGTVWLTLAHLSEQNNRPLLAYNGAVAALTAAGIRIGPDCRLQVAPKDATAPMLWL